MAESFVIVAGAFVLLAVGMWIPFVIAGLAMAIILSAKGVAGLKAVGLVTWSSSNSFTLTAIPLFVLMAEILLQSGLASRLYGGLSQLTRRLPGGLLQTNIIGCAIFSAISGSSVATAAAIGTVAVPELEKQGYDMRQAYGSLAAGGTLGILIPPSIALIVYGAFTESSIVKLFAAGLLPGLVLTFLFASYVAMSGAMTKKPRAVAEPRARLLDLVIDVLPVTLLIALVLTSLYAGFATPTEAAAIGCSMAALIAFTFGKMDRERLSTAFRRATRTSSTILIIVVAAFLFSFAMAITGISNAVTQWVLGLGMSPPMFLVSVALLYVFLGLFVESIAMMVITVPLLAPAFGLYGIDPIWFGVFLVILIEIGQITPPFGLNLFVVQSVNRAEYRDVVLGALPYYAIMLAMLLLLALFPGLALWLPGFV
ncbi:TRAP transporter large permease [Stappia sp.]|uniref:TRAP transporter large permease n=1 Tax=Stappia sp. TaxID=1870903 RepID=UPI003A98CFE3